MFLSSLNNHYAKLDRAPRLLRVSCFPGFFSGTPVQFHEQNRGTQHWLDTTQGFVIKSITFFRRSTAIGGFAMDRTLTMRAAVLKGLCWLGLAAPFLCPAVGHADRGTLAQRT